MIKWKKNSGSQLNGWRMMERREEGKKKGEKRKRSKEWWMMERRKRGKAEGEWK